jgi:hypothetical protein
MACSRIGSDKAWNPRPISVEDRRSVEIKSAGVAADTGPQAADWPSVTATGPQQAPGFAVPGPVADRAVVEIGDSSKTLVIRVGR